MGDYTKSGIKIGTCGQAYYATLNMLSFHHDNIDFSDEEVKHYINPKNKCSFAFPFPEWDNKKIGEISAFHDNIHCVIYLPSEFNTHHGNITHHIHPRGGEGVNLFIPCPYKDETGEHHSRNLDKSKFGFQILGQKFQQDGSLAVMVECIYCKESQSLELHEAQAAADSLLKIAAYHDKECAIIKSLNPDCSNWEADKKKADWHREVAKRVLATYNQELVIV